MNRPLFISILVFIFSFSFHLNIFGQEQKIWTGSVSSDWSNPGNWSPVGVPGVHDDIIIPPSIPNYPSMPILDKNVIVNNMIIKSTGHLILNGHRLELMGDIEVDSAGSVYRHIRMTNPTDTLFINGNMTFYGANTLDSGVIILKGNFKQKYQSIGLQSFGTKFIFMGENTQEIYFEHPGLDTLFNSFFDDISFNNKSGVILNSDLCIRGQMILENDCFIQQAIDYGTYYSSRLPILKSEEYNVSNTYLHGQIIMEDDFVFPKEINNVLISSAHELKLNKNKLTVGGNLIVESAGSVYRHLQMLFPEDTLIVTGNVNIEGACTFDSGTVFIKGDFHQESEKTIIEPEKTQFIFNGDQPQKITFDRPGPFFLFDNFFKQLQIQNQTGVTINSDVYVLGNFINKGTINIPSGFTLYLNGEKIDNLESGVIEGNGKISSDTTTIQNSGSIRLAANTDTLTIAADINQSPLGAVEIHIWGRNNNPVSQFLNIDGDYLLNGKLHLHFPPDSTFLPGDSIRIIGYQSKSGIFDTLLHNKNFNLNLSYKENGLDVIIKDTVLTPLIEQQTKAEFPDDLELFFNYPNPFNQVTKIIFSLKTPAIVHLTIFDIQGRMVANLPKGYREAGKHSIKFQGDEFSSGVYYYVLTAGKYSKAKKMLLIK